MPNKDYEMVIGIELFKRLNTKSKLFCGCSTLKGIKANESVCPTCMGLPGTTKVMNENAIFLAIRTAIILNAKINKHSQNKRRSKLTFNRGYQISQKGNPIVKDGKISIEEKEFNIKYVDVKDTITRFDKEGKFDYNSSDVPQLKIVSKPNIKTTNEAVKFIKYISFYLHYAGISFDKDRFKVNLNISLKEKNSSNDLQKVKIIDVENYNDVVKALKHESIRQVLERDSDNKKDKEIRIWDPKAKKTIPLVEEEKMKKIESITALELPDIKINEAIVDKVIKDLKKDVERVKHLSISINNRSKEEVRLEKLAAINLQKVINKIDEESRIRLVDSYKENQKEEEEVKIKIENEVKKQKISKKTKVENKKNILIEKNEEAKKKEKIEKVKENKNQKTAKDRKKEELQKFKEKLKEIDAKKEDSSDESNEQKGSDDAEEKVLKIKLSREEEKMAKLFGGQKDDSTFALASSLIPEKKFKEGIVIKEDKKESALERFKRIRKEMKKKKENENEKEEEKDNK